MLHTQRLRFTGQRRHCSRFAPPDYIQKRTPLLCAPQKLATPTRARYVFATVATGLVVGGPVCLLTTGFTDFGELHKILFVLVAGPPLMLACVILPAVGNAALASLPYVLIGVTAAKVFCLFLGA